MSEDDVVKHDREEMAQLDKEIDDLHHRLDEEDKKHHPEGPTFYEEVDEGEA